MSARSYLYVPGDRADRLAKASERGADALIADLEDSVAPSAKESARATVAEWVRRLGPESVPQVWVRVNSGELMPDDVRAVVVAGLAGIYVSKTDSVEVLTIVDELLSECEGSANLPTRSIRVAPLIESALGMLSVEQIARGPRVSHLALGEADLRAELGITPSDDAAELAPIRMQIVLASAAGGIAPPVGGVLADFRDLDALRRTSEGLRRMGFRGRAAIHPDQVPVINEVFTPTTAEIESARKVLALYEEARARGTGVIADENGRMIDEAVARAARQTLSLIDN